MAEPRTYSGNGHTATIADPENITREECLALAQCGCDAWNSWRIAFPSKLVDGSYLNRSNFSSCEFRTIDFANFSFDDGATFEGAIFHLGGGFKAARFGRWVDFSGSIFKYDANFEGAIFFSGPKFQGSCFCGDAGFRGATFGVGVRFEGAIFMDLANFSSAVFLGEANFSAKTWKHLENNTNNLVFRNLKALAIEFGGEPDVFHDLDFSGALFQANADFSGRQFLGRSNFGCTIGHLDVVQPSYVGSRIERSATGEIATQTSRVPESSPTTFCSAPSFYACSLHQDTNFDEAVFPVPSGNSSAIRAYRTLKLAFSQQQATREEQRFFRLEMAEEAKAAEKSSNPVKWLYIAYREFADFGFSVRRPALLLAITLLLMLSLYGWQAGLQVCWPSAVACDMTGPLIQFASAHALPGFEKLAEPASKTLFGDQLGVWTVLTLLFHKAVSVLALFLIGLALRNLFKMK